MSRKRRVFDAVFMAAIAVMLVRSLIREAWWEMGLAAYFLLATTLDFFGKSPMWAYHPTADMSKSGIQRWRERRRA